MLMMSRLDNWEQLRGVGKECDVDGELYSSKDRLVDEVIQDIFAKFPERDSAKQSWSKVAFTHEERDSLHTVRLAMESGIISYAMHFRGSNACSTTACPKENQPGKPDVLLVTGSSRWPHYSSNDTRSES
jgi:hypothetical protein